MRLLFVSHSFPPRGRPLANVGGMQRVATELHAALRAHPEVEVSTLVLRSTWKHIHTRVGPYLLRAGWTIWQRARRREVDVVLFTSMVTATLAVPLRRTLEAHGVAAAAIVHGLDVTTPFAPYQWFVPHVFGALRGVLPVSQATGAACLARGLPPHKLHVVPNGIDLSRFAPPARRNGELRHVLKAALDDPAHPLPEDAFLLCSVGRQVERKGFAWFVDHVMPRLPAHVHYWLAGDGPRADAIRAAVERRGLAPRVRLLGRVSEGHLRALYQGADLYVMPNVPVPGDMEGFGVVMLEAGRCGLPTVAADLEGIRDVISEGANGRLVEPEDPRAFAEAIRSYCQNGSLEAASQRAARHVTRTFGWPAIAERYVRTLRALRAPPAVTAGKSRA